MDDHLKEIGKYISFLLRHKPEAAGLRLDEYGWANVDELIAGVSKRYKIDLELLKRIVAEDDKQRYSFNSDLSAIRANQGHSVEVDVELERVVPPETLFHGTGEKFVDSILQLGLIPKSRLYVHLSKDYDTATKVGLRHGKPVIFSVLSKQMVEDGYEFFLSANGVWLTKSVPTKYLILLKDNPRDGMK